MKANVEHIKEESRGLRGELAVELAADTTKFSPASETLLKFHGMYQQVDREARKLDRTKDHHQFMVRTKLPGGRLTAAQYLVLDRLADDYANGTLRITSRQDIQFHGILKHDIQATLQGLNHALITTLGACGDIVRNVMACPMPSADPRRTAVQDLANTLSDALFPKTRAYHQIWLDGEELIDEAAEVDPLYRKTYLPRKFKITIAYAGDNCVDVYAHDVGLVALFDAQHHLLGYNLLAGGGMGMTHGNDATYARLADEVCFVSPGQVEAAVRACVAVHRDFGDRTNRKHARLKYVLHERGRDWFKQQLETALGGPLPEPRPMPEFVQLDHLGWSEVGDGSWCYGQHVENGRIKDFDGQRLRTGIRAVVERWQTDVRLTAQQNLLFTGIRPQDRAAVAALLKDHGLAPVEELTPARRFGLACVAIPTCGLAITEAERVFPQVISDLDQVLAEVGLPGQPLMARMTGCPNGCVRPYVAEVAFVGRSGDKYAVYVGGHPNGTRLALPFLDLVPLAGLATTLKPVFAAYRAQRLAAESFGDFCTRVGVERLRGLVPDAKPLDQPCAPPPSGGGCGL